MTYKEALDYIKENSANSIIPGLSNMEKLCSLLGNPENKIKTIHIAGTNGKGSVGSFISHGLIENGYNVGRYISPSVLDYRDKFLYNNQWISENEFAETVSEIKDILSFSDCRPTVFELETAIAFYWINKKQCDFAVIETGMGGRLDATNVTDKILSVITPIAIDHTKFLGTSIEQIAMEKAGIIKDTAVSAQQISAVQNILQQNSSHITFVNNKDIKNISYSTEETVFDYKNFKNVNIKMLGKFQVENACLALEALSKLSSMGYKISNLETSLKNASWSCRFQVINKKPLVIIDGAHNVHGINALVENIKLYLKGQNLVFITGVLKDKDYVKMAETFAPFAKKIYTVASDNPRSLAAEEYAKVIRRFNSNVTSCPSINSAINSALKYNNILIFGSLSFMGEIHSYFKEDLWKTTTK